MVAGAEGGPRARSMGVHAVADGGYSGLPNLEEATEFVLAGTGRCG